MKEKILPINTNPPVKYFLHHALPLSMILADNKNKNFLYANYIQLYKSEEDKYLLEYYPRIGSSEKYGDYPLDNLLTTNILTGTIMDIKKGDLISYMTNWIDQGYYVHLTTDERYLTGASLFNYREFHNHQALYIGYDKAHKKMKMINYDQEQNYKILDISFSDIKKAFNSPDLKAYFERIGYKDFVIQLKRVRQDIIDYNYTDDKTIAHIKRGLTEYVSCKDSARENLLHYSKLDNCTWGVDVYDYFYKAFQGEYDRKFIFQCTCGLLEHKQVMKERMEYLSTKGVVLPADTIEQLKQIIKITAGIKNAVIKAQLTNDYSQITKESEKFLKIRDQEVVLLEKVIKAI